MANKLLKLVTASLLIICCTTVHAQRAENQQVENPRTTSVDFKQHLDNAGNKLQSSTGLDILALTFAGVGVITSSQSDTDKDAASIGVACAAVSVLCEFAAICIRKQSGVELKLAAGCLSVTF